MGYFESQQFRDDFTTLIKSMLLISKKLEDLTGQIEFLKEGILEDKTTKLVTPPQT